MEDCNIKEEINNQVIKARVLRTKHSPNFRTNKRIISKKAYSLKTQPSIESLSSCCSKPIFGSSGLKKYKKKARVEKDSFKFGSELPEITLNHGFVVNGQGKRKTPNFGIEQIGVLDIPSIKVDSHLVNSGFSFTSREKKFIRNVEIEADSFDSFDRITTF